MMAFVRFRTVRRLSALVIAFAVAICAACTGPTTSKMVPGELTLVLQDPGGTSFSNVRITLIRIAGDTAVDTTVAYSPGSGALNLTLNVQIDRAFYSTGEPMSMALKYLNASGQVIFSAGPTTVTAKAR
jgi:hypothetical protein